jgi:hypothetical protein
MWVEGEERLVAEGHGVLVGYDYEDGGAQPLPDQLCERLRVHGAVASNGGEGD